MKEHEDASRIADTTTVKTSNPPDLSGLVHHYRQWSELDDKKLQLRQAKQDSESPAITFTTRRDALESNVKTQKQEVPGTGGGGLPTGPNYEFYPRSLGRCCRCYKTSLSHGESTYKR